MFDDAKTSSRSFITSLAQQLAIVTILNCCTWPILPESLLALACLGYYAKNR